MKVTNAGCLNSVGVIYVYRSCASSKSTSPVGATCVYLPLTCRSAGACCYVGMLHAINMTLLRSSGKSRPNSNSEFANGIVLTMDHHLRLMSTTAITAVIMPKTVSFRSFSRQMPTPANDVRTMPIDPATGNTNIPGNLVRDNSRK